MKARTVILFVIAKLMAFVITASAAVMSYLPLAYFAYEERGYFAIGGEVLGALIVTAVVGWAAKLKAVARERMREENCPTYNARYVNTECAFEAWGIDVKRLEKGLEKIERLGL